MRLDAWPGLSALQPDRVRQFLRSRGWTLQVDRSRPPAFHLYALNDAVALVPGLGVGDFQRRMVELVSQLAEVHAIPVWQLVDDLSAPLGDVLEIRIQSESVRDGTLPLEVAATYRQAARDLILAGAHAALDPRPHSPRLTRKEPLELLSRCREGQSARGSYRIRLIVPMDPQVGEVDQEPLARQAVRSVHGGAQAAVAAVERDQPEALLTLYPEGVSANLLAALANLEPPDELGSVSLAVRWSHGHPHPGQALAPVRITRSALGHFRSAAQSIRATTPEPGVTLEGYVVQLRSNDAATGGTAFILAEVGERDIRKVSVPLAAGAYQVLVEAHKRGVRVRLIGRLWLRARSAELQDAAVVEVLDER